MDALLAAILGLLVQLGVIEPPEDAIDVPESQVLTSNPVGQCAEPCCPAVHPCAIYNGF